MSAIIADLDPALKNALNFLHSPNPRSAEELRNCLDLIIKQRHGTNKMLINTISKKHLAEEMDAPGLIKESMEIDSLSSSLSPQLISDSPNSVEENPLAIAVSDVDENLKDFGDLACVICGDMMFTATNRLIECSDCHSLYHQDCHKPSISDEDAKELELSWYCTNCKNREIMTKAIATAEPEPVTVKSSSSSISSSSSSNSPSPFYKQDHVPTKSKKSSSKSSSSSSHRDDTNKVAGSSSKSSSSAVTPNINIISASGKSSRSRKTIQHFRTKSSSNKDHDKKKKSSK